MRRLTLSIFLVFTALIFPASRHLLSALDDPQPDQPSTNLAGQSIRKARSSGKTVVNDVVYGMEEEESRLYLGT